MTMSMGGKMTRRIGLERNNAWWGLNNLTYNFLRYILRACWCVSSTKASDHACFKPLTQICSIVTTSFEDHAKGVGRSPSGMGFICGPAQFQGAGSHGFGYGARPP